MNTFIFQLALIFLPGIIWARIDSTYGYKGKINQFELILKSFLFGVATYIVVYVVYTIFGWEFGLLSIINKNNHLAIDILLWDEVVIAILVSFFLSIIWLYAENYKWLTRFLQLIHATKTYGDEDVWDFTLNSNQAAVEYAHLRDFKNKLTYAGWISTFSESGLLRELVLTDVEVFDLESGECIYSVPRIYIAREPSDISLEFPYKGNNRDEEMNDE